jgi:tRNA (guanine37-N1)-methyltransferase
MAFDIIGDIAILKPPLKMSEEEYIKYIQEKHKYIQTILLQETDVLPPYRVPKYKILWGENKTETVHKEYGLRFKVDVVRAYYSPRLAEERKRIASQVKDGEKVLVMFAGVNPYSVYIAKYANPEIIYAVELNPFAFKYAFENAKLNKVESKITTILGDVRKVAPFIQVLSNKDAVVHCKRDYLLDLLDANPEINRCFLVGFDEAYYDLVEKIRARKKYLVVYEDLDYAQFDGVLLNQDNLVLRDYEENSHIEFEKFGIEFDRIIMPLPKEADTFLDVAIPLIKEGGTIHLYQFFFEEEIPEKAREILDKYSKLLKFEYEILNVRRVGDIAPRQYRVCIDFKVTQKLF